MRHMLTGMSAILVCCCLYWSNTDPLHTRIGEHQTCIASHERQITQTRLEVRDLRRETDELRAELAKFCDGTRIAERADGFPRAVKLQIRSLLSGSLNQDGIARQNALVAQLALVDSDGQEVILPGVVELRLIGSTIPEQKQEIAHWKFSADECRRCWVHGLMGSGYQFTVPLPSIPESDRLILQASIATGNGRTFDATQIMQVAGVTRHLTVVPINHSLFELDDVNDPPPEPRSDEPLESTPDWGTDASQPRRDSTNWTERSIPQFR